jgi:uncharacterized protein (TIGR02246 family)
LPEKPLDDEQAIRDLVFQWQRATATGDLAMLLSLMAEDVVFLVAGQPPLRGREEFSNAFRSAMQHVRIDATSEIQEIRTSGELAYCWNHFSVVTTPLNGDTPKRRSGYTLTVLRKTRTGSWVVTRDANMLSLDKE